MQQINGISMFSLRDLEDQLPVSYFSIRQYIRCGKLRAVKIGRAYWVSEGNLTEFLNSSDFLNGSQETVALKPREHRGSTQLATDGATP